MTSSNNVNDFFEVRSVPHAGSHWTYADAKNVMLIVLGWTQTTERWLLIRQYRPPMQRSVLSLPMGAFPDGPISRLCEIAATEAEAETGHAVHEIEHVLTFARSPGLTNERAHCFYTIFVENRGQQVLHHDEDIDVVYVPTNRLDEFIEDAIRQGEEIDSSVLMLCGGWLARKRTEFRFGESRKRS